MPLRPPSQSRLYGLAVALVLASIVLSVLFKGFFVLLLIPALFAWGGARSDRGDRSG